MPPPPRRLALRARHVRACPNDLHSFDRFVDFGFLIGGEFVAFPARSSCRPRGLQGGRGVRARGTREVGPDKGNVRIMSGFFRRQERDGIRIPLIFNDPGRSLPAHKDSPLSANVRILSAFMTGYKRWRGLFLRAGAGRYAPFPPDRVGQSGRRRRLRIHSDIPLGCRGVRAWRDPENSAGAR